MKERGGGADVAGTSLEIWKWKWGSRNTAEKVVRRFLKNSWNLPKNIDSWIHFHSTVVGNFMKKLYPPQILSREFSKILIAVSFHNSRFSEYFWTTVSLFTFSFLLFASLWQNAETSGQSQYLLTCHFDSDSSLACRICVKVCGFSFSIFISFYFHFLWKILTLSWRMALWYWNQSIDLLC